MSNNNNSDNNKQHVSNVNETSLTVTNESTKKKLPVLPLKDTVIFPYTLSTLVIDDPNTIKFINKIADGERLIGLFPEVPQEKEEKDNTKEDDEAQGESSSEAKEKSNKSSSQRSSEEDKTEEKQEDSTSTASTSYPNLQFETFKVDNKDLSYVGVLGRIVKLLKFPDNTVRVLIRGLKRIRMVNLINVEPNIIANIEELPDLKDDSTECVAMARNAQNQFQEIINLSPNFPDELKVAILNAESYTRLIDLMADSLNISFIEKLGILTAPTLSERFQLLTILLNREVEVLQLGNEIQNQVSNALSQSQREFFLREQLKAIKQELGEEDANPDITGIRKRMSEKDLPEKVKETIDRELERLATMPQAASEYHVTFNYIDWLLSIPWKEHTKDRIEIKTAKNILHRDHYDLKDVKERILEFLAVIQKKKDNKAPILCFVGPPGVGKTSLGKSIASAMKREFVRISLGGVRDEAEIRGHRRTYVGALPGKIIQGLKKAGTSNPVFMLDEIDKVGNDFRGDPASALLEVLDPQQNHAFSDHYLDLDFDLSSVMFITTANILDTIPPALLDRMEILRLPGYTPLEKRQIAKRFLLPRQLQENGLTKNQLSLPLKSIDELITYYTREAGVRNLERTIGRICRKVTRKIIEGESPEDQRITINPKNIKDYLGPREYQLEEAQRKPERGLAIGMAWTAVGGTILPVESTLMPGKGNLHLTGSLGNVMKESGYAAFSYVKSNYRKYNIDKNVFSKNDFHLHVPDGATPKDGPSAGITIAVSLVSLLANKKVKVKTSMTGEITLRGKVTSVGGIKEKLVAAQRTGIKTIVLPKQNEKDLENIPEEIKNKLDFVFVENIKQALDFLLIDKNSKSTQTEQLETKKQ